MKLVVIGGVAGGASTAARVRRLDHDAEIVVFEKGEHVSYSNCALPYHLSGTVEDGDSLVLMTPEAFKNTHNIEVRVNSEVVKINRDEKTVTVKAPCGEYKESYDKLVIATGAAPVMPKSIKGIDGDNVFVVRNVTDIKKLKARVDSDEVKKIAVVGGGFIGVEVAENLKHAGKDVCLIEGMNQIMAPFDYDMVQILHKEMDDNGVKLYLSSSVSAIGDGFVTAVKDGEEFSVEADAVVMAIGVRPETGLAVDAELEIGVTGGIKVNHNYQTSDADIYAVGDVIESFNSLTHKPGRLALAGPAQRQARAAADHMYGIHHNNKGFIGSSCVRIFGQNAASTGLNCKTAAKEGFNYDYAIVLPPDKVGLMPDSNYLAFKLIFEVPTGRILGAQAIGRGAADKRIDVIAAMITMGATLEDLKELELCYSPVFGTAKDVVNYAALAALNILYGRSRQVHLEDVRALVESGAYIIDVRDAEEYEKGHIVTSHNIPMNELTARKDEIPTDRPVYVHCRTSHRSYYAFSYLKGMGFTNVWNIQGSYLGISLYEYFNDKKEGRKPILTDYNFE
ncbi:MAG: FAD-dependent oxidoreductase [Firmicutes bacterium]|nr:FAD-dependent oxidoreductase [Bacillota bacterium]MBQ3122844.1 FAD-dependent oxidoreductase [Bacillota bacterium]MBQ9972742.1 FAD-dependent oxidoreductase [Bacillota bacterium]